MFVLTPIVVALLVSTAVNVFVTVVSWRRRNARYSLYFALFMTAITFWSLMSALDYAATALDMKIFFATLEGWGYMSAHPLFTLFALSFAGYDWVLEKKWAKAFFVFVPVSNIIWVTTNRLHGLVWQDFIQKPHNVVVFTHGPAYWWIYVSGQALTVIMLASLVAASFKGSAFSRKQGRILLASVLLAEGANIAYNTGLGGVEGVDWTGVAFSVIGALVLWALYGQKFLDIVPIAREKLIDSLSDGMLVLDLQGQIVDLNQSAARMIGSLPATLLGQNIGNLLPLSQSFMRQSPEKETRTELEIERRYFDALVSPLIEKRSHRAIFSAC